MLKKPILVSTLLCVFALAGCGQVNDQIETSNVPTNTEVSYDPSTVKRMCAGSKVEKEFYVSIAAPGQGRTSRVVNYGGAACMSSYGPSTVTVRRFKEGAVVCQISIEPGDTQTLIALTATDCTWE